MFDVSLVRKVISKLDFSFPYSSLEWANNPIIENYHKHSDYSNGCVTDSVESTENYAKRSVELGATCLFSTEHGSQGNAYETYTIAQNYNLKYRHGSEAYWVKDRHEKDRSNCHIVLIARNDEGRKDINYALSIANTEGFYYQPRIDLELILAIPPENVICTSACVAGWKYEDADEIWLQIKNHFGDNFYWEVQPHLTSWQADLNRRILTLREKHGGRLIAGMDSHAIDEKNVKNRSRYQQDKNIEFHHDEEDVFMDYPDTKTFYDRFARQGVLSEEEILEALMNTLVFQVECEDINFDRSFKIPNLHKDLCYEDRVRLLKGVITQAYKKDPLHSKEKVQGIRWEMDQFIDAGVVDYPLFSKELVDLAINKYGGILTTTSRGSAASFVTNKLLGFTTVDRYNAEIPIHPQRFLTKDRILAGSLPDIDFNISEQEPFLLAARELLGEHGSYPLMTLNKLKEKNAWKMYARINNVEASKSDEISKMLEKYQKARLYADEDERDEILIEDYIPPEYIDLYRESVEYQGITDGFGTHACAFLCFDGDIRREIGLISAKAGGGKKRTIVAAIEGKYLDSFGYLKQDFLIVDVVSLIYKLFARIGRDVPSFEELKEMVKDDPATWDIYARGITVGVNQCEKERTIEKVMRYKPKSIAELSGFVASIRPGFKSLVNTYLDRRPYSTGERAIDEILSESANFLLYQESIMSVLSFLGVEMQETYDIIKSISKKKLKGKKKDDLLAKLQRGWLEQFGNTDNFSKVWQVIEDSASYAFNSPHSYSMAGDSLYVAWFKAHYPAEFYEVAIEHYGSKNKKDKMAALLSEATKFFGFELGRFEFGKDHRRVNVDKETKKIYPPMTNIKGFGEQIGAFFYEIQKETYEDFFELLKAMYKDTCPADSSHMKALIRLGYFEKFGSVSRLEEIYRLFVYYRKIGKSAMKETLAKNGLDPELAEQYGRATAKKIMEFDKDGFFKAAIEQIGDVPDTISDRIRYDFEFLETSTYKDESAPKNLYVITGCENSKKSGRITLYHIKSGRTRVLKFWNSTIAADPVDLFESIYLLEIEKRPKVRRVVIDDEVKWVRTDEMESWMKHYKKAIC